MKTSAIIAISIAVTIIGTALILVSPFLVAFGAPAFLAYTMINKKSRAYKNSMPQKQNDDEKWQRILEKAQK
jgi:uroporphyrinogen-III decarboxylase